ncbi:MAG: ABC transporter permease, partial [Chloroflexaceae bacterium]|nr:ABC transporter permease [Chloroflexaceae bacterium]
MIRFLIRRLLFMIVIIFLAAVVSFVLLSLAPGNPVEQLRGEMICDPRCPSAEEIARLKARYDLDLALPLQFSRWFIGQPRGPVTIGDQQYLG